MADEDRLDVLPDALLSIIVSSLPFNEGVRTSILPKRWVRIWQAAKNIELHESFFVRRDEPDQRIRDTKRRGFINFATNFIRFYQKPTARKFSLSFSNPRGIGFVDECIRFVVSHHVETLELDFSNVTWIEDDDDDNHLKIMFDLLTIVYEHENIQSLMLSTCDFRATELAKLITLKHLCLGWIEVRIREIRDLIKKCVMLESLNLKKCWNIEHFEIGGNNGDDDELRLTSLVMDQ